MLCNYSWWAFSSCVLTVSTCYCRNSNWKLINWNGNDTKHGFIRFQGLILQSISQSIFVQQNKYFNDILCRVKRVWYTASRPYDVVIKKMFTEMLWFSYFLFKIEIHTPVLGVE